MTSARQLLIATCQLQGYVPVSPKPPLNRGTFRSRGGLWKDGVIVFVYQSGGYGTYRVDPGSFEEGPWPPHPVLAFCYGIHQRIEETRNGQ